MAPGALSVAFRAWVRLGALLVILAGVLSCGGGGGGATGTSPAAPTAATVPLGVGLEGVTDWARARMFADLIKSSRRFGTADTPWDEAAPVDADGWPTTDFGVVLWTDMASQHGYGGTYKVRFKGPAGVTVAPAASVATFSPLVRDAATGVCTLDMTVPEGAEQLMLTFRNTGGGLRELSILRPGHGATQTFGTAFLDLLKPFQVLRCMDVLHTNNNPVATWAQRARPTEAQWATAKGVPWEVLFQLARETGKDLWINVPHQADDDYVRQLAQLAKAQLPPDRVLYVEYSNEVWNWQFDQAHWAYDRAGVLAAEPGSPLTWGGETNPGYWHWRFVALRLKQISDLFRAEYGSAALGPRVRPVLAGQVVQPLVLRTGLDMIQGVYGPARTYFWGLAGAPYFSLGDADLRTDLTVDEVLAALEATSTAMPTLCAYDENAALALGHGLPFVAYEGGPDTFGPHNTAAKAASARDPRMAPLCRAFLARWYGQGFGLFNWFTLTSQWGGDYGTWGLTDDPTVGDTPKFQALRDTLAAPLPALVGGAPVPADLDARRWVGNTTPEAEPYLRYLHVGDFRDYLVRVPAGGIRELVLEAEALAASRLTVTVDGEVRGSVDIPATGGEGSWTDQAPLALSLTPGLHVLRLTTAVDGGFALRTLRVR